MTLTRASTIKENHAFELRAAFYNAFNQVRRSVINTSAQYVNLSGTALYNQYRTGVGHTNLTEVSLMRVIEIGLKYRF